MADDKKSTGNEFADAINEYNEKSAKEDKEKKKDGKKPGSKIETYFKLFAVGAFLMGTPFAIGVFAVGLLACIAKWGYGKYKNYKAKKLNDDMIKAAKEANGELPEKDEKYQDLAKSDNMKDYVKNLGDTAVKFAETNLGKKLMANPAFTGMVKSVTGIDPKEALEQYKNGELLNEQPKVEAPSDPKIDDLANKMEHEPAKDVTAEFQDILDEYDEPEADMEEKEPLLDEEEKELDQSEKLKNLDVDEISKNLKDDEPDELIDEDEKEEDLIDDDDEWVEAEEVENKEPIEEGFQEVPVGKSEEPEKKDEPEEEYESVKQDEGIDKEEDFKEVPFEDSEEKEALEAENDEAEYEEVPQEEPEEPAAEEEAPSMEGGSGASGIAGAVAEGVAKAAKTVGEGVKKTAEAVTKAADSVEKATGEKKAPKKEEPKKDDKKKDEKEKEKPIDLETMFKIFVIGAFLMGTPFAIAVFAVGLAAVIGKKVYDWRKGKNKEPINPSPKELTGKAKEVCEKNDPAYEKNKSAYEKFMSLAFDKDGKELSPEAFKKNVDGYVRDFARTKEGKELLNNPQFQQMYKGVFGADLNESLKEYNKEELQNDINKKEAMDERQHTHNTIASEEIKDWKKNESDLETIEEAPEEMEDIDDEVIEEEENEKEMDEEKTPEMDDDFDPDQQIDLDEELETPNEETREEDLVKDEDVMEEKPYNPDEQIDLGDGSINQDYSLDGSFNSQVEETEGITTEHIEIDDKEFPREVATPEEVQNELSLDKAKELDMSKGLDELDMQGLKDVFSQGK